MKSSEKVAAVVVVVVIIAILGFGVYPSLRAAPGDQCLVNLEAISKAVSLYVAGAGGHLPPGDRWVEALDDSIVLDWSVFVCPEARFTAEVEQAFRAGEGRPLPVGYSLFRPLGGSPVRRLDKPDETPWVFDSKEIRPNSLADLDALAFRHAGRSASILFADGHAKRVTAAPQVPRPLFRGDDESVDDNLDMHDHLFDHVHDDTCNH